MINKMISALYKRELESTLFMNSKSTLFISKLKFILVIYLMTLILYSFLYQLLFSIFKINFPKSLVGTAIVMLILYFLLNYFTWKLDKIEQYCGDPDNFTELKSAWRLYLFLLIGGTIVLMITAKYNEAHNIFPFR